MTDQQLKTISSYDKSSVGFHSKISKLPNYNETYDELASRIPENGRVLDLACGPAQISKYLIGKKSLKIVGVDLSEGMLQIARREVPDGVFHKASIIDFHQAEKFDAVVVGFGLPYLDKDQVHECLRNCWRNLKTGGSIYLSFMNGSGSRLEKTSFGDENVFLIFYHEEEQIQKELEEIGFRIEKKWVLGYLEQDGSVTRDVVILGKREP